MAGDTSMPVKDAMHEKRTLSEKGTLSEKEISLLKASMPVSGIEAIVIEDDIKVMARTRRVLREQGLSSVGFYDADGAMAYLELASIHAEGMLPKLVIADCTVYDPCRMQDDPKAWKTDGRQLISSLNLAGFDLPVIIIDEDNKGAYAAIDALRIGAAGYVAKDWEFSRRLEDAISRVAKPENLGLSEQQADGKIELPGKDGCDSDLLAENRKLKSMLGNLPGIAYICKMNDMWNMQYMTGGCLELTGHRRDELMDNPERSFLDVIRADDRQAALDEVRKSLEKGGCFKLEYRIITSDGTEKWVWDKGCVSETAEDGHEMVSGFILDITDKKQLEERLKVSEMMSFIRTMARGIAHNTNNSLAALGGNLSLLADYLNDIGILTGETAEYIKDMKSAFYSITNIIRQFQDIASKKDAEKKIFDIYDIVESKTGLLQKTIGETIKLSSNLPEGKNMVDMSISGLEHVLINLVYNSCSAIKRRWGDSAGGLIEILPLEYASAGADEKIGDYAGFVVKDNGIGMTDDVRRHIFTPGFTTNKEGSDFGGLGLGMATVYETIINAAGGKIDIDTKPGEGTAISIYLPRANCNRGNIEAKLEPAKLEGSETILLVDDEDRVRGMYSKVLNRFGYDVIEAANGIEGLEMYDSRVADIRLVITDVEMPEGSGTDLIKKIKEKSPDMPIIVSSGYDQKENPCYAGMKEIYFLGKPCGLAEFAGKVREILDRGE